MARQRRDKLFWIAGRNWVLSFAGRHCCCCCRRTSTTRQALEAMAAGKLRPAALSIDQRVRLLKHSDKTLQAMAIELFGGAVSSNRQQVGREYQEALTFKGSAAAGAKVFKRICSQCHRIDGQGHQAGPDISDVRNRSRSALLYDILDPNAKVEPRFTAYTVVTDDGKSLQRLDCIRNQRSGRPAHGRRKRADNWSRPDRRNSRQ